MVSLENYSCGIPWAHESLSWSFLPEALHVVSGDVGMIYLDLQNELNLECLFLSHDPRGYMA